MEEARGPPCEIWPDNWRVILLFDSLCTQWRVGFAGAVGLDYGVLYHKMDRMKLADDEYEDMESCIRVLEDTALETMRKKQ